MVARRHIARLLLVIAAAIGAGSLLSAQTLAGSSRPQMHRFQTARTFLLGPGRAVRTFTLRERSGVILLNRVTVPHGVAVVVDADIPHVAGARVTSRPSRNAPSLACRRRGAYDVCTQGEEGCPMPQATWHFRLVKLSGPRGPIRVDYVVAPPSRGNAPPLYGFAGPPPRLYAIDPSTLQPHGRGAPTAGHAFGWSFSPDRSRLAAGSDVTAELRLYDLHPLRVLGDVGLLKPSVGGLVFATTWASSSRVMAAVVTPGCCGLGDTIVSAVDTRTRRVLWRRDLHGSLQAGTAFRGGFVLVLGPKWAIGASRLLLLAPDGRVRTVWLDQIRSGWQRSGSVRFVSHQWNPGLAVDPTSDRAFVVQAGAPVAEVDLRRLSVRYHELAEPISLLGRLHDWLEPKAEAKAMQGPQRQAVWLAGGRLAVSGVDDKASIDSHGQEQETDTPAGLKLIDTHTWSVRTLDHTTSAIAYASGVLFALGTSWNSQSSTMAGSGLTAYDRTGRELYHRYRSQPISGVHAVSRGVLVEGDQGSSAFRRQDLLQPRTGRVIGHARVDVELISGDEPFWF